MVVNGFVVILVCSKRQLRTKTNTFIVSLAVADFGVGIVAVPSLFRTKEYECIPDEKTILIVDHAKIFIVYASGSNLFSLVLERYIGVVKPLQYLTIMKRRRVIKMVLTSWAIPFLFTLTVFFIRFISVPHFRTIGGYLYLLFEVILCVILIFCPASMFLVVYKQNSGDRTLAKQLQFNQQVAKVKTQNTAAVNWVALVTSVLLLCYGIMMHCSLLLLTGNRCGNDDYYKIPLQVVNSGINSIAYAFFKRE